MSAREHTVLAGSGGRRLRVTDHGPPGGAPVLVHHGTPGAAVLFPQWLGDAAARGLRLIAYDRPGYGGSSPHVARTVGETAADVAAIADALGLDRLLTWGWSGGGPHALACADLLRDRVVAAVAVGSPAPFDAPDLDFFAGMAPDAAELLRTALHGGRGRLMHLLDARRELLQRTGEPYDPFDRFVAEAARRGLEPGVEGWAEDLLALVMPWDFDPTHIPVPVAIWHGERDDVFPCAHGRWLAQHIPGALAHLLPAEDDRSILAGRSIDLHDWLHDRWVQRGTTTTGHAASRTTRLAVPPSSVERSGP